MAAGKMLAPRIAVGSSIVDGVPTFLPNMLGVATPEEARRAVRTLKDAGAGFIKVYWFVLARSLFGHCGRSERNFKFHLPVTFPSQ